MLGVTNYTTGRWPANVMFDEQAAFMLDEQSGNASRFFYCAKASKSERNAGLEDMPEKAASNLPLRSKNGIRGGKGIDGTETDRLTKNQNFHPTVKPIKLMEYLIKLITPRMELFLILLWVLALQVWLLKT